MERRTAIRLAGTLLVPAVSGCSTLRNLTCTTPIEAAVGTVSISGRSKYDLRMEKEVEQQKVAVTLRNEAEDYSSFTESRKLYDIQERAGDAWRSIYCVTSDRDWGSDWVEHEPGSGFTWKIHTGEEGTNEREGMRIREPITSGTYRFVYFGLIEPELQGSENADEQAIAVQFDVPS